jgi:hypothetical protein
MNAPRFLILASGLCTLLACRPQADTNYGGEPLVTLHGTITLNGPAPSVPVEAALVWLETYTDGADASDPKKLRAVATRGTVTSSFPAEFTMDVLTTPPADALSPCDPTDPRSVRFAEAGISAIDQAANPSNLALTDFYGGAVGFSVIYVESEVGAGGCRALPELNDRALAKGYHLVAPVPVLPPATIAREWAPYYGCRADASSSTSPTDPCASLLPDGGDPITEFSTPITITIPAPPALPFYSVPIDIDFNVLPEGGPEGLPACLPQGLLGSDGGGPACTIVVGLTTGSCYGIGADVTEQPIGQSYQRAVAYDGVYLPTICELPEVPSADWSNGTCAGAPSPGWCYVAGAAAAPCGQSIVFADATSAVPSLHGARATLMCAGQ